MGGGDCCFTHGPDEEGSSVFLCCRRRLGDLLEACVLEKPACTDEVSVAMIAPVLKSRISFKILMIMACLEDWIICPWKRST